MHFFFNHFLSLALLLGVTNCNKSTELDAIWEANYNLDAIQNSNKFELHDQNIISQNLKEISGIVGGIKNDNMLYMIEDKGNDNEVYVFNQTGQYQTKLVIHGVQNIDWEDIAIGPGPQDGENYIYIGDIGDNDAVRTSVRIIRFVEPDLSNNSSNAITINDFDIIDFQYPTGPRDAETLLVNPFNKDLIIMTKREAVTRVYFLSYPYNKSMNQATFVGLLPFIRLVGGDISSNGQRIAVKNKSTIYYWETVNNNIFETLFRNAPSTVAYAQEPQGESIGFSKDGTSYFTISETKGHSGAEPILYHFKEN